MITTTGGAPAHLVHQPTPIPHVYTSAPWPTAWLIITLPNEQCAHTAVAIAPTLISADTLPGGAAFLRAQFRQYADTHNDPVVLLGDLPLADTTDVEHLLASTTAAAVFTLDPALHERLAAYAIGAVPEVDTSVPYVPALMSTPLVAIKHQLQALVRALWPTATARHAYYQSCAHAYIEDHVRRAQPPAA